MVKGAFHESSRKIQRFQEREFLTDWLTVWRATKFFLTSNFNAL